MKRHRDPYSKNFHSQLRTAIGCHSNITIPVSVPATVSGAGLLGLGPGAPTVACRFGEAGSSAARLGPGGAGAAEVSCTTPPFGRMGETSLHLDFLSASTGARVGSFPIFSSEQPPAFTIFDIGEIAISPQPQP